MTRAKHMPHKILLILLPLAAFSLPFVMAGIGTGPDTTMIKAGAGVLNATVPKTPATPSGNGAAVVGEAAGNSISATNR